jgi:hypothetical protein
MAASNPAKLFMTALLIMPIACFAQSGGSGGGSSGGSSSGGTSATGGVTATPNAGSPGAGSTAINGVTGPANPAGGAAGGRIDGTVTQGPRLPGDEAIKDEDAQNSKVDKKIKSICRGC